MQGDHVRLGEQRRQINILHAQIQRGCAWVRIKRQQAHTKAFQDPQGSHANFAGADNASGFTVHGKARQAFQREVGITGALISAVNTSVQGHHHADGMFRDRFRGVCRNAYHPQTQLLRRVEVHVIEACTAQGDILHPMLFQLFQHRTTAIIVHKNADAFTAVRRFGGFFGQQKVEKFKLKPVSLVNMLQILFVVLLCAIYREFHKTFSSDFAFTLA